MMSSPCAAVHADRVTGEIVSELQLLWLEAGKRTGLAVTEQVDSHDRGSAAATLSTAPTQNTRAAILDR